MIVVKLVLGLLITNEMDHYVCCGCLSRNRELSYLTKDTINEYFDGYLKLLEGSETISRIKLCWECIAVLKKIIKFKKQVQKAQYCLRNSIVSSTLSTLVQENLASSNGEMENFQNHCVKTETSCYTVYTECDVETVKIEPNTGVEVPEPTDTVVLHSESLNNFTNSDDEPLSVKQIKKNKNKLLNKDEDDDGSRQHYEREERVPEGLEVVLLSWQEVVKERQKITEQPIFKDYKYKCMECALGFNHGFKYENHMKKHDPSTGSISCSLCGVRFKEQKALAAHTRRHKVRWRCVSCLAMYSRCAVAADHLVKVHKVTLERACKICGANMPTVSKLRSHIRSMHRQTQTCELCGKSFKNKTSLQTHMIIHQGVKEYSCPHCNKGFIFKKAMQLHAATHEETDPLYCHECDVTFKNQNSYSIHMKYSLKHINPEKLKFACNDCDKRFSRESRLREHRQARHLKVTPVQCTVDGCNFACASRPVLRNHIRTIHKKIRTRNYVCHLCGKSYTAKKSLEGHLRSHVGSRPLACVYCSATFSYEAALYNHIKLLHKGDVP